MIQFYNRHAEPLPEDINIRANELYDGKHYPVEGKLFIGLGFVFHHVPGGSEIWHDVANGKYESFYGADQTEKKERLDHTDKPVKLSFYRHKQQLVNLQVDINRAVWASNLQYANDQNRFNSDQVRDEYIANCLQSAMDTLMGIIDKSLPTDDEILKAANDNNEDSDYQRGFESGAIWMRDRIRGNN